ncbi:MAG TPA: hypothetical protein VF572_06815 [Candidatus Saccharimonadales bacterium]
MSRPESLKSHVDAISWLSQAASQSAEANVVLQSLVPVPAQPERRGISRWWRQ